MKNFSIILKAVLRKKNIYETLRIWQNARKKKNELTKFYLRRSFCLKQVSPEKNFLRPIQKKGKFIAKDITICQLLPNISTTEIIALIIRG